ncbi:MAG: IS200/IS605 family transposase [Gemmatimonadales bacterium]
MPFQLYVLVTWTTFTRARLITEEVAAFLRRFLPAEADRHGAQIVELSVVADDVHALLRLPQVVNIPRLLQGLKRASARVANRDGVARPATLRWAAGYDLRSIGPRHLQYAVRYLRAQRARHGEVVGGMGKVRSERPRERSVP